MLAIEDPDLPGLAHLTQDHLRAMTGAKDVALLRLRYRPGKRAILHMDAGNGAGQGESTLWFFKGDKAKRLARRNKAARFDPEIQALFEVFPNDHRMPQIRNFLDHYSKIAPDLVNGEVSDMPVLLRYRPGLSCTFRCAVRGQAPRYVKLINDDDPVRLLEANRLMSKHLSDGQVSVARAIAKDETISAIAYASAIGLPLDEALVAAADLGPLEQAIRALKNFGDTPIKPERSMSPDMLLERARASATFVAVTAPSCRAATATVIARLAATVPQADLRPIHGDMKLEHLFIDGSQTTLIDTESVSFGPPDYDLAQFYGRLWQADLEARLPRAVVQAGSAEIRKQAGPDFHWCLDVVALRLAKYYAQRPAPDISKKITSMLERLA